MKDYFKNSSYGIGVVPPLITPIKKDGSIDQKSLKKIIKYCINGGVHGIFILGSTGEGPCFTQSQKRKIICAAKEIMGKTIPLYVGVMDSSTSKVKENTRIAEDNGADILVITPIYYLSSKSQDEIIKHIEACTQYTSLPIMVYNIPQMTNINISLFAVEKIVKLKNVIGLKDSSGDWEYFQKLIFMKEKMNFKLLMGAEDLAGIAMLMGADGCVSGMANFAPKLIVEMYEWAKKGNLKEVKRLQYRAARLRMICFQENFWLAGLKYACSLLGLCKEYVSMPLLCLTNEQKLKIKKKLNEGGFI